MPIDLTVGENQVYILDDAPPDEFAEAFQRVSITSLPDLVEFGVVDSEEELQTLLTAARTATDSALGRIGRWEPQSGGLARPDLGRFNEFALNASEVPLSRAKAFWQVIRDVDPPWLVNVGDDAIRDLDLASRGIFNRIGTYTFNDLTIQPGGTLDVAPSIDQIRCEGALLIRGGGRIVVRGSGLYIKAFSIQGE